jgi:hypothetical protein
MLLIGSHGAAAGVLKRVPIERGGSSCSHTLSKSIPATVIPGPLQ